MYALCTRVLQNKKRAKRVRRKNGKSDTEKSQKTDDILDADENGRVTGHPADIASILSSNNEEKSCERRVMVGDQADDAGKISELWKLVAKPRKQRVGQLDKVPCDKGLILQYNTFEILLCNINC